MLELVRRLLIRKAFLIAIVLVLTSAAHADNWIRFPTAGMGPGLTQTFDIAGFLDAEPALGVQVGITLTPVMVFGGSLSITSMTTLGSTFEIVEGANWMDFSDPSLLAGMTLDWTNVDVSGNITVGSIELTSSPDALGVWAIEVVHFDPEGYLDPLGGASGTLYNGEIGVVPIPEPTTLALAGWGVLGTLVRRRRSVRS